MGSMIDNHLYNLMMQVVAESKSLQRISSKYEADAGDCEDCKAFWQKMKKDKESHIEELVDLVKKHVA